MFRGPGFPPNPPENKRLEAPAPPLAPPRRSAMKGRTQPVPSPRRRKAPMPSFDIVSRTDLQEVENAVQGIRREIGQRFDFKGSKCSIERKEQELVLLADADF